MVAVVVALVVLSILILIHELGHFLVAKQVGIKVEEFGLGYPPRIWGKKIKRTIYSINFLPFGGFVRLYGEELGQKVKDTKNTFWAKSKKARVAVIIAGVLANFLLAVVAFGISYSIIGIPTKTGRVQIVGIAENSPAQEIGLKENDIVFGIDERKFESLEEFTSLIDQRKGSQINLIVKRGEGETLSLMVVPRQEPPEGEGALGVIVSDMEMVHYPFWQMPFRGAIEGFKEAFAWTLLVLDGLKRMVGNLVTHGAVPKDIAGPIGILQITGTVAGSGSLAILQFMGILSVNLAVLNILPFPALDGGRLMFVLYELITRKRPKPELERWVNSIGMLVIILLLVLVTINDLSRIWQTSDLSVRFQEFWPF